MSARRLSASAQPLTTGRAIRVGVATGLLSFAALLVASRLWRADDSRVRREVVRPHDSELTVWVGELAPGLKAALASPWNQDAWDRAADETLRGATAGSRLPADLVLYDCWVFNTGAEPAAVVFRDGLLVVRPTGAPALALRSLGSWLAPTDGRPPPSGGPADVLRALGADRDRLELPPGRMARQVVAFARRVELATLEGVVRADGTPFRARRIRESEWAQLIQSPRVSDIENL